MATDADVTHKVNSLAKRVTCALEPFVNWAKFVRGEQGRKGSKRDRVLSIDLASVVRSEIAISTIERIYAHVGCILHSKYNKEEQKDGSDDDDDVQVIDAPVLAKAHAAASASWVDSEQKHAVSPVFSNETRILAFSGIRNAGDESPIRGEEFSPAAAEDAKEAMETNVAFIKDSIASAAASSSSEAKVSAEEQAYHDAIDRENDSELEFELSCMDAPDDEEEVKSEVKTKGCGLRGQVLHNGWVVPKPAEVKPSEVKPERSTKPRKTEAEKLLDTLSVEPISRKRKAEVAVRQSKRTKRETN
jgi:hypothetical protein